jgi:hypothetical protein
VADTINKLDMTARIGSGAMSDVELVYGSPAGPAYDKDAVERVKVKEEKDAKKEEEPPPPEEKKEE